MITTVSWINKNKQIVEIGEFSDIYHPLIFLKGLLDRDNDQEKDGEYLITYEHEEKHSN